MRRYLGLIDDKGHGAVAIGNPDYAKRNAILVPGTGQDLSAFEDSDLKSLRMYDAALRADPTLRPGDVAVTTWMGYDRPMNLFEATSPDRARAGADALDRFDNGQRASHVGGPSIDTVIGTATAQRKSVPPPQEKRGRSDSVAATAQVRAVRSNDSSTTPATAIL